MWYIFLFSHLKCHILVLKVLQSNFYLINLSFDMKWDNSGAKNGKPRPEKKLSHHKCNRILQIVSVNILCKFYSHFLDKILQIFKYIYTYIHRNRWEKYMTMRTLYLNTTGFWCLFLLKRHQKQFVFKYKVLIAIYFSHLSLYIKFSLRVLNSLLLLIYIYMCNLNINVWPLWTLLMIEFDHMF